MQFRATPLRRFVFFAHLRTRYWVWVLSCCSFPQRLCTDHQSSCGFSGRSIRTKGRGLLSVQVSWKQTDFGLATVSSPSAFLSWILFDMMVAFSTERKWLRENIEKFMILFKQRRLHHLSRVKLPSVNKSARWVFFVSTYLIWILVQVDPVKQQIQRNSVGPGNVSHCWTSAFNDHLDHGFFVLKHIQLCFTLGAICVCGHLIEIWQLINILVTFQSPFDVWCAFYSFP